MEIKVSKWKLFWKGLVGGREAVFDYLLDVANTAASKIPEATREDIRRVYETVLDVRARIDSLAWVVPSKWRKYYASVLSCIDALVDTLGDGRVEKKELESVLAAFQSAYAVWRAD